MTSDTRTTNEIERDIEAERSKLTSNLEGLQDKFSIDTLVRQVREQFSEHGGDLGKSISDQVKANPIPLALTGIGLAWMMFGNGQKPRLASEYESGSDHLTRSRLDQRRPYTGSIRTGAVYDRTPSWALDDHDDRSSVADRVSDNAASARDTASRTAHSVRDGVSSAAGSVSDRVSSAGSSVADAASSAKSSLESGARSVRSGLEAAGSRISEGTETLTEESRQRVIAARQKAKDFGRRTATSANDGADAAAEFFDRQPLVVGALALAFGAALGGALPRTKTEDNFMGGRSDDLYDEAERIFEEEKAKAVEVARSVKDEVKDIARETKSDLDSGAPGNKTAAEALGDQAKSAATRVGEAAKETARDQDLGKPKS